MKTFLKIGKHLQLLTHELNGSMIGRAKFLPNAMKQTVNLQVVHCHHRTFVCGGDGGGVTWVNSCCDSSHSSSSYDGKCLDGEGAKGE
jgi:hypothetical protein